MCKAETNPEQIKKNYLKQKFKEIQIEIQRVSGAHDLVRQQWKILCGLENIY